MAFRDRAAFFQGIRYYVPGMQFASELVHGHPTPFSLGSPAANSATALDTDIDADGAAGLVTTQSWTADSPFGRTLTMSMDADPGAALGVYDVYGYDYLGQRMIERFTHINGATSLIYGKKAFYTVDKVVNITAATNATTVNLGTGWRMGLPYKSDIAWAKENGVFVPLFKRDLIVNSEIAGAAVAGGASGAWVRAEFPGYVKTLIGTPNMPVGSTNDPVVTVELGGVAITGLTVTIDTSAGNVGTTVTDTPTTAGYSVNNRFRPGDLIEIVVADADTSGAITVGLELTPTQFTPAVTTDPAIVTTGDPRGTYEPILTPDGSELIVGLVGDPAVNAAGNGGLHGIAHFAG